MFRCFRFIHHSSIKRKIKRHPESAARWYAGLLLAAVLAIVSLGILGSKPQEVVSVEKKQSRWQPELSSMGQIARGDVPIPDVGALEERFVGPESSPFAPMGLQGGDQLVHSPTMVPDYQTETTIAVNVDQVVVGFNDWRGFSNYGSQYPARSISGYAYSADGGATWNDGGQLPVLTGVDQVNGDPDVKTWTDPTGQKYFFYSSLYRTDAGDASLCVHMSTDGGATWSTPGEITTATSGTDFPDKEFMCIDEETGRIFVSWTNFGATTTMRVTYSDDYGVTWTGLHDFGLSGQGSVPRAAGNSDAVYVTWRRGAEIIFARSANNGISWGAPYTIVYGLGDPMNPYGSDRIHGLPSMDVDWTTGDVYIVYASRELPPDFSDIYFIRSTNNGSTWTTPLAVNAAPGVDRAQFFPWITVDQTSSNIAVIWYDQVLGTGTSDSTDVFHTHSYDAGVTWDCPSPLTDFTFHAEYGNTTSQPNLGDYNQAVYVDNYLYTAFGRTGDASYSTSAPDAYFDLSGPTPDTAPIAYASVNFQDQGCCSYNGHWEPGEDIDLFVTIRTYSNCVSVFPGITGITGALSTTHPNVTVDPTPLAYGNLIGLGDESTTATPFLVTLDPNVPCGDEIEFLLHITSSAGEALIPFKHRVGHPVYTPLLEEDFDGVAPPALPAGWTTTNLQGTVNPWVTSTMLSASGPNALYCPNIATTSHNEVESPTIIVPPNDDLVEVTFDVTHNLEDDFERRAWDGALLRMRVYSQKYLAGYFSTTFEPFYPWQLNRNSSSVQPLQDLACWSSDITPDFVPVKLQYPGLHHVELSLVFALGTDNSTGTTSGMFVDNISVSSIEFQCDCTDPPSMSPEPDYVVFEDIPIYETTCDSVFLRNLGPTDLIISGISGCTDPPFTLDTSVTDSVVAPGDSTMFVICATPTSTTPASCTVLISSNDPESPARLQAEISSVATGIAGDLPDLSNAVAVVPNPFNPDALIRFGLPERMPVTVEVWSATGARVRVLAKDRVFEAGTREIRWRGRNDRGEPVASGVYFVRVKTPLGIRVTRAVLLK